jgi:hypothetical protein
MATNTYTLSENDLQECWDFSVGYFLDPKKGVDDRTNFMGRGLGGIADSFMKKIHEIAVREIIKQHNMSISPITDFELHDIGKTQGDNRTEPDIIRVFRQNFTQKEFDSLNNSINSMENILNSRKKSSELLKKLKLKLKLIKDCNTVSEKETTRKALSHWISAMERVTHEIDTVKQKLDSSKKKLKEFKKNTTPKIYVEIKNSGIGDSWIGPKLSEVNSITSRKNLPKKSIYYIYCRLRSTGSWKNESAKKAERNLDPLGVFLKRFGISKKMEDFHDVAELHVDIQNILSVSDIENYGTFFPKGTIIPDPKIFTYPGKCGTPYSQAKVQEKIDCEDFKKINLVDGKLPKETSAMIREKQPNGVWKNAGWAEYPDALGDFIMSGNADVYSEELTSLRRLWIKCNSTVTISNKVIGNTKLKKEDIVCYQINKKGRIDKKNVDDYWISVDNTKIMKKFSSARISEIAKKI